MADQPTLEQDLWEMAMWLDQERPGSPISARLRAAAARLRKEMANVSADPASQWYGSQVLVAIERINGGPAPATEASRCPNCVGESHLGTCLPWAVEAKSAPAATPTTPDEPEPGSEMAIARAAAIARYVAGPAATPTTGMEPPPVQGPWHKQSNRWGSWESAPADLRQADGGAARLARGLLAVPAAPVPGGRDKTIGPYGDRTDEPAGLVRGWSTERLKLGSTVKGPCVHGNWHHCDRCDDVHPAAPVAEKTPSQGEKP